MTKKLSLYEHIEQLEARVKELEGENKALKKENEAYKEVYSIIRWKMKNMPSYIDILERNYLGGQ
jgi:regulator of replication initiation timing